MRNNYDKELLYIKCDEDKPSKNPYVCSLYEINKDSYNCSEDYTMRMSCSSSYNVHTKCGARRLSSINSFCQHPKENPSETLYSFEAYGA